MRSSNASVSDNPALVEELFELLSQGQGSITPDSIRKVAGLYRIPLRDEDISIMFNPTVAGPTATPRIAALEPGSQPERQAAFVHAFLLALSQARMDRDIPDDGSGTGIANRALGSCLKQMSISRNEFISLFDQLKLRRTKTGRIW